MRSLMRFIDEMPAAAVRVPTFNLAFLPRFAAMSEEEFLAFAESKPLRKEFMLAMGRNGFPQKEMDAALDRFAAPTSAWTNRSRTAAGRGCWARHHARRLSVMPAIVRMADLGREATGATCLASQWYELIRAHPAFKPTYYSARC